ncbi:hypothetical protein HX882_22165 [Pseudomonas gingeri]|uniref:Uncharacterized protein n=1 Tax=Pseudomonas gingeri TaxID=117681 RepID=A0A7Y7XF89_9PSED|nr:hypothetical protein [Pseudomonas gingeri]NWB98606.1 hypothetical protein [Pseudomonas gingeri]
MKIIFVHGTGVRLPAFEATFNTVKAHVAHFLPAASVTGCYWGDHGSDIGKGLSVPLYDQARAINQQTPEDEALAEWALLYDDPLVELRLLAARTSGDIAFDGFGDSPVIKVRKALAELRNAIDTGTWPPVPGKVDGSAVAAIEAIDNLPELDSAIAEGVQFGKNSGKGLDPLIELLARAVTAGWVQAQMTTGSPVVPSTTRDALQLAAFHLMGGSGAQVRGVVGDIVSFVTKPLRTFLGAVVADPVLQVAAWGGRTYRHSIANAATPAVGDILLYQARGETIRSIIAKAVADAGETPVVLLAHSLGGIACIDLLISSPPPQVKAVITAGSQAPFLYEIGALTQLQQPAALPGHMPSWLNIYDRDDLLSFKAEAILGNGARVSDCEIRSHQPFPASHSAYWDNVEVWKRIAGFLETLGT